MISAHILISICSYETRFFTEPERIPNTGANYGEATTAAAANLDETINTLVKNFGEGSDYFKVRFLFAFG